MTRPETLTPADGRPVRGTQVSEITRRGRFGVKNIAEIVSELSRVFQGWGHCFRSGNANGLKGRAQGTGGLSAHRRLFSND